MLLITVSQIDFHSVSVRVSVCLGLCDSVYACVCVRDGRRRRCKHARVRSSVRESVRRAYIIMMDVGYGQTLEIPMQQRAYAIFPLQAYEVQRESVGLVRTHTCPLCRCLCVCVHANMIV